MLFPSDKYCCHFCWKSASGAIRETGPLRGSERICDPRVGAPLALSPPAVESSIAVDENRGLFRAFVSRSFLENPQMWVWPQLPFGGSAPISPPLQLKDPALKPQALPSPPYPSLSPPCPRRLARRGFYRAQSGWRGRALQAALAGRPTSGGAQ